jgi:hypothetical protein
MRIKKDTDRKEETNASENYFCGWEYLQMRVREHAQRI